MNNILVTGGAGFIGSNYVRYMLRHHPDYTIVNFDALTYAGNLENLTSIETDPRYHFVKGSITDRDAMESVFAAHAIDAVVHFAAESHVDRSITGPSIFIDTNIVGTNVLLEVARKFNVEKFLHVSTDEVYGSLGAEGLFTETTPLHPNSPYSASKASSDLLVLAYQHTFGFPGVVTRCSNNYGPYQFPEKLIPLMIANALNDKQLPVYGNGMNVRDWLFVGDHCSALDTVLHTGVCGEVYNIGGNNEKPNIEIVKLILEVLGKPESLITYVKDRPGHDLRYAIDAGKMKRDLGWEPAYTFEAGMKQTIEWYLENRQWWERILSGDYQKYFETMYAERLLKAQQ